ncbi:MAG: hypothetical protein H7235_02310 [Bdellovibrionaceae bacterium]|nr:hypothetical protein [Pseudobdellovibrionaceae bacterium]
MNKIVKIGKKGGAKRISSELTRIRKTPISKEVFEIVENFNKNRKHTDKKSAKPSTDLGV